MFICKTRNPNIEIRNKSEIRIFRLGFQPVVEDREFFDEIVVSQVTVADAGRAAGAAFRPQVGVDSDQCE